MKKVLCSVVGSALVLSLTACTSASTEQNQGGVNVESPVAPTKSDELKAQYDFYKDTAKDIVRTMKVTNEQGDEIFQILVDCGLNQKPTYIIGSNGSYTVNFGEIGEGVTSLSVKVDDSGVVTEVKNGSATVYPLELTDEYIIANVTSLIENLNVDSSHSDYETAQAAFDALTSSQQKEIPEELVTKLKEYSVSTATLEQLVDSAIESVSVEKDHVSINDDLGTGSGKIVLLYLKGSDNLTNKMIKTGMLMDTKDILQDLQLRDDISEITFFWSFPLVDAYGNTSEDTIMKINISKETLGKINFERFDYNSLPDIADDYFEHPALSQ